jgi:hypothetical protein
MMNNVQNFDTYSLPELVPWLHMIGMNTVTYIHDLFLLENISTRLGFIADHVLSAEHEKKSLYIKRANKSFASAANQNIWQ